jgi:hypothetical protein
MHSLETILCLLALLGCLGLLAEPIIAHQAKLAHASKIIQQQNINLRCSTTLDAALSAFVRVQSGACSSYAYALHANANPLSTSLGGDSNHYA